MNNKGEDTVDRFSKLNPKVTLLFFLAAITVSLVCFEPLYLGVSLLLSILYAVKLRGAGVLRRLLALALPILIVTGLFNMLFTDYGQTVLFVINTKTFTFEGFFYGLCNGIMLCSVLIWIYCYSFAVDSGRLLSVFSGIAPDISLTVSMTLAFLPRLRKNAQEINASRQLIDTDKSKLKKSISSFSALISLTLEESIELAESMKGRGYGKKRRAYNPYGFATCDYIVFFAVAVLFSACVVLRLLHREEFVFEPVIKSSGVFAPAFVSFTALCVLPFIIDFAEDMKWLFLKLKN